MEKLEVYLGKVEVDGKLLTDKKAPYLEYEYEITVKGKIKKYNPEYGDDKICARCGHTYEKHFDSWENYYPIGCKYCDCEEFVEKKMKNKGSEKDVFVKKSFRKKK